MNKLKDKLTRDELWNLYVCNKSEADRLANMLFELKAARRELKKALQSIKSLENRTPGELRMIAVSALKNDEEQFGQLDRFKVL